MGVENLSGGKNLVPTLIPTVLDHGTDATYCSHVPSWVRHERRAALRAELLRNPPRRSPMASDLDFLFQAYSVSVMVLLVLYFVAQMSAIDPNDHMKEDATLLAGERPSPGI